MPSNPDRNAEQCLEELVLLLDAMKDANELYRPTQFWAISMKSIVTDLRTHGFSEFKSLPSSLLCFVPNYAKGREKYSRAIVNLKSKGLWPKGKLFRRLERYLSGFAAAHADYRVATAAFKKLPPFMKVGESPIGDGLLYTFQGRNYSKASLNYLRGLALLEKSLRNDQSPPQSFLEIGGGSGCLGEIVLQNGLNNRFIDIDIPPVLTVATYYLKELFGEDAVTSFRDTARRPTLRIDDLFETYRAATLPSWQLQSLSGQVDCFVNFVSFQEMEPHVVENYIKLVQPLTKHYVILRNSHHGKKVTSNQSDVGVKTATSIDMMISWFSEFDLVARDSMTFGEESRFGKFRSEVAVLHRKL